jgi:basic membrane protein A
LKRVDVAVYDSMTAGADLVTGGFQTKDLAAGGVGYALDEHNAALVSADMKAAVDAAAAKIISGEIVVHDYFGSDSCPSLGF